MTEAIIKSNPAEDLQYRSLIIKANNKTLETPIKAIDYNKLDSSIQLSRKVSGLNEFYLGLTHDKIFKELQGDSTVAYAQNSFKRRIRNPDSELQICFF